MGTYSHIARVWKRPKEGLSEIWQSRLIEWRRQPVMVRVEKPTRLDRARNLGYKAKQGIIVVRTRIKRGGRKRPDWQGGRRQKRSGRVHFTPAKSLQRIAEERVGRKHPNMEVLNSYYVAEDGKNKWFEIILVDPSHPSIKKDKQLSFLSKKGHAGRAERGLTSQGKKGRGLRNRGKGAEKVR